MTTQELINAINNIGNIKDILNSKESINKVINFEDKHILIVFSEMINHLLRTKELLKEDLSNLKDQDVLITLIQNNPKDLLLDKIKYLCFIQDADMQISLFTNPIIINYIADESLETEKLDYLYIDTRLVIIEGLIRMNYRDKSLEILNRVNEITKNERNYYDERERKISSSR